MPEMERPALTMAIVSFAITGAIGLYFAVARGLAILPLGILGLVVIFIYTNWLSRNFLLCLVAPGLGFGTLMVMGTDFALTGSYSWTGFMASLVPFFLVSNLLLLNQFPDVEADKSIGRKHLPIVFGRRVSAIVYDLFLLLTYVSILVGIALGYMPWMCLLGLGTLLLAVPTAVGAYRYADDLEKLAPYMGFNVLINILTPVLVGIGFLIG